MHPSLYPRNGFFNRSFGLLPTMQLRNDTVQTINKHPFHPHGLRLLEHSANRISKKNIHLWQAIKLRMNTKHPAYH